MTAHISRSRLSSADSFSGYLDTFPVDCVKRQTDDEIDNAVLDGDKFVIKSTRDSSTQTDLALTFPEIFSQIFRDVSHDVHSTTSSTTTTAGQSNVSYANINKNNNNSSISGRNKVRLLLNHFESMSADNLNDTTTTSAAASPASLRRQQPSTATAINNESSRQLLEHRVSQWIDGSSGGDCELVADLIAGHHHSHRLSNSTLYEDIDDLVEYFEDAASVGGGGVEDTLSSPTPPPLPPRFRRSNSLSLSAAAGGRRKDLSHHLGLAVVNQSTLDIAAAQRIALEHHLRQRQRYSRCAASGGSRKDLSKFLGINEASAASPVKLRKRRSSNNHSGGGQQQLNGGRQHRNSVSFMESLLTGKLFQKSGGSSSGRGGGGGGSKSRLSADKNSGDRPLSQERKRLEDLYDSGGDLYDKSRSSSFSSTVSTDSSVFSSASSSSTASSNGSIPSSSGSMPSSSSLKSSGVSVSRLWNSTFNSSDFISNSLRTRHPAGTSGGGSVASGLQRRRNSIQSVFDVKLPSSAAANKSTAASVETDADVSHFIEDGLPIIPFSSSNLIEKEEVEEEEEEAGSTTNNQHRQNRENVSGKGETLDAVISFAKLELSRSKANSGGGKRLGYLDSLQRRRIQQQQRGKAGNEDLYMDMSPNASCIDRSSSCSSGRSSYSNGCSSGSSSYSSGGEIYMDMDILRSNLGI